jgi:peptidyl-prolyl cis-trans isomerase SurA
MIKKIKLFVILLFILTSNSNLLYSQTNIKIIYKINNKIITNIDIENEAKYLIALNNQLERLDPKKIMNIAKDSIIREKIKEFELVKYFLLDQKNPYLDKVVKDFYTKLGLENEEQFKIYLSNYNLTIKKLKKKIEIETLWNQLIYDIYSKQINVDIKSLEKSITENKMSEKNKKYLLSEIIFEKNSNETLADKILKINNSINEIGFKNTANTFSVSDSAKFGGNIGWITEIDLSKKISKSVKSLKVGETTQPIRINKNYLILKLEEIKEEKVAIKKDDILKRLVASEKNRQLNQFSNIHFSKAKINTFIDEL